MSNLGEDGPDKSRAIEYLPKPPPSAEQKSFRHASPGRGFRKGRAEEGRERSSSRPPSRSADRRPSADLDINELYGSSNRDAPMIEAMPAGEIRSDRPLGSSFVFSNPHRPPLSTPPPAEKKHLTPERPDTAKKQSKPNAAPSPPHNPFSFSVLLSWAGKGKKAGDTKPENATSPSPLASVSPRSYRSFSRGTPMEEKKDRSQKAPAINVFDPNAPILRFLGEKIVVPGPPQQVTLESKSDVFAKAVILSMEAITAAREMYKEEPFNDSLGIQLVTELEAVADIYKSFGDFLDGATLLQEAISLRRDRKLGSKLDIAVTMNDLGLIYCELQRHQDAYDLFREAHRLIEEHSGGPCLDAAACMGNAGVALRGAKIYGDAVTANDMAHSQMSTLSDPHHIYALQQKAMLALTLHPAGDVSLGTRMLKDVIDEFKAKEISEEDPYFKYLKYEYARIISFGPE